MFHNIPINKFPVDTIVSLVVENTPVNGIG